jgi:hypothetical protein
MIRNLLYTTLLSMLLFACSKSDSADINSYRIEYRLTAANAANISVVYNGMYNSSVTESNVSSSWSLPGFLVTHTPFTASLFVTAAPVNPGINVTVNLKIIVNGSAVRSQDFSVSGAFSDRVLYIIQ